jgi:sarcosine oxidase subunit beta
MPAIAATATADVIVIGAGVQGASLAFHLAERGARVIVVERSAVAAGATGRSSGLVRMHYHLLAETQLAWASFPYFRDWAARVGGECGFTQTGFLWMEPADGEARLRANVAAHRALGIETSVVDADDIRRIAPALVVADDEVAAYEPESGYADPSGTTAGLMRAARDRGATLVRGAAVTAIPVTGGRVTGVQTTQGAYAAPVVVNAAGGWAARVAALVGLEIPVTVWRHDTGYVGVPAMVARPLPVVIDNPNAQYLRPEGASLALIGLEDENGLDGDPDRDTAEAEPGFAERVTERVIRRIPALADGTFQSAHSGQDGLTPDQRPILGQAGPDGFVLDCGHSGTGFKTAPAVGLGMAELILDGAAASVDISPFRLERFAEGRPLVGEHGELPIWR